MRALLKRLRPLDDDSAENAKKLQSRRIEVLPEFPAGLDAECPNLDMLIPLVKDFTNVLERRPFGLWAKDCHWDIKRQLFRRLPTVIAAVERQATTPLHVAPPKALELLRCYMLLMEQLLRSGYAQSLLDRHSLVEMGLHRPGMRFLLEAGDPDYADLSLALLSCPYAAAKVKAIQVQLYVLLAEHVAFSDACVPLRRDDFWNVHDFTLVLREMPAVFTSIPDDIAADQWDMYSSDLEAPLRTIITFLIPHSEPLSASTPMEMLMSFLNVVVDRVDHFDKRFGAKISARSRGAPLEELVRLAGVLFMRVMATFEDRTKLKHIGKWARLVLQFLVKLLMLEIPTVIKTDSLRDGRGDMPTDERQQDSEWIEELFEHIDSMENCGLDPKEPVCELLARMVHMPLEEQRYRLECISPLIPAFVNAYSEQLKEKLVPPELSYLKTVINSVMQDGVSMHGSELLEELSFYPCLLEFATKRALIHGICERTKLQIVSSDPIRLVVPRDNVLDGVCKTLNFQDAGARIEAPLEIAFRAGYADDTGNELVDEGEDQGGLRRQWLDRASRYFVASDLFMSPAEDASHLEPSCGPSTNRRTSTGGLICVPSAESVCRCVQDDWQEQYELFGCVLGFAILYKETLPVHFGHVFLRSVFGLRTDTEDLLPSLETMDKTLHTKLKYILDGSYRDLGDTLQDVLEQSHLPNNFTLSESHCPEIAKNVSLKEGGDELLVSEQNKEEFVTLLLERVLIKGVATQVSCFRRGLLRVVPEELVQRITELMTVKEIELMVCGADDVDVDDWQKHTNYENGYTAESQPVRWFWDVVRKMTPQQQASLLFFATGSSQVPSGGFRFLQPEMFSIQRVAVTDRYPEAHTCANMVDLPEYTTMQDLQTRLLFAIEEAGDVFGRR